jgi:16S rRNA (cytosine1402-N4)-methyltransferase
MLGEALGALGLRPGGRYLDATFGAGGYTREILASFPDVTVIAFDRDPSAVLAGSALAGESGGRLALSNRTFSAMADELGPAASATLDGVVMDIGVSSMQVDRAERGFSFRLDAPLDMRMGDSGPTAADIVNDASEAALADILHWYGEERLARPLARAIVRERAAGRIASTRQLADICAAVIRARPGDIHPATRAFQALRIAVNDELRELVRALHAAETLLRPGGSLVVVSFHSLEDRLVKLFLAARDGRTVGSRHAPQVERPATFVVPPGQPVMPDPREVAYNPRARSARLRHAVRTAAPPAPFDSALLARASLPGQTERRSPGRR